MRIYKENGGKVYIQEMNSDADLLADLEAISEETLVSGNLCL